MVATAESCTGGLVAATLTEVAGSSDMMDRGFVTYSPMKPRRIMLGVPEDMIGRYGAVSGEVAAAMAEGALARGNADVAIAVTGIAGPDGGSRSQAGRSCLVRLRGKSWAPTFVHKAVFPDHGRVPLSAMPRSMTAIEIVTETAKLAPDPAAGRLNSRRYRRSGSP